MVHCRDHDHVHADEAGYVAFAFEDERPLDEPLFREFIRAALLHERGEA